MYFTWAAAHRHSAARCNAANYVCGNDDGVAWKRTHEEQLEYCVLGIAMPECKHPNTPDKCCDVVPGLAEGECVCYMEERTDQQEARLKEIIEAKIRAPEGRQQDCDFEGYVFREDAAFADVTFEWDANFTRATFSGATDLSGATFKSRGAFSGGVFYGGADFRGANFHLSADFTAARFNGSADFAQGAFYSGAHFRDVKFNDDACFWGVTVADEADFARATFSALANFTHAIFGNCSDVWCEDIEAYFRFSCPLQAADFTHVTFRRGADFTSVRFRRHVDFVGATSAGGQPIIAVNVHTVLGGAASLYRLAKQSHQHCGEYGAAGEYHYLERLHLWYEAVRLPNWYRMRASPLFSGRTTWRASWALWPDLKFLPFKAADELRYAPPEHVLYLCRLPRERKRHWWGRIARLRLHARLDAWALHTWAVIKRPDYIFGNLVFGYGERLWRPVWTGGIVIVVWAFIYLFLGIHGEIGADGQELVIHRDLSLNLSKFRGTVVDLWDSLYFSVVTFSTLGYGDIQPTTRLAKLFANVESLIGLVLVAAFAVCLAKRFARG